MNLGELAVVMQLVMSGGGQLNTGQIDLGFMWARYPNGTCMRIDVSQPEKQIPKAEVWINTYDVIEMNRQFFEKNGWIVYNTDPNNLLCKAVTGTSTHGLFDVPAPPVPVSTVITAPAGAMTTPEGIWTFGTATSAGGNVILLNGTATTGFGKTLQLTNGKVYTFTADGKWFVWNGSWLSTVAP